MRHMAVLGSEMGGLTRKVREEAEEMPCDWIPSCVGRALQAALQAAFCCRMRVS